MEKPEESKALSTSSRKAVMTARKAALTRARKEVLGRGSKLVKPLALARHRVLAMTTRLLGALIIFFFIVILTAIYGFHNDSAIVYGIARLLPFPAAQVNGELVPYKDYLFEVRYRKNVYAHPSGPNSITTQPVDFGSPDAADLLHQIQADSLRQAKLKAIIGQLAAKADIQITDQELEAAVQEWIDRQGGLAKFQTAIDQYYGWNLGDFKQEFRQQLLAQKLQTYYQTTQQQLAKDILARIKEGEDFEQLVEQYSQDPGSKDKGGDVGFVGKDTPFVKEFKEAALKLKAGQVSGVIKTQFGYHILKATEIKKGKVRISHILISTDLGVIAQKALDEANTRTFIRLPAGA